MHVPGDTADGVPGLRRKFRKWARDYTRRRGEHIPRAFKVRGGSRQSELDHWIIFHYLRRALTGAQSYVRPATVTTVSKSDW